MIFSSQDSSHETKRQEPVAGNPTTGYNWKVGKITGEVQEN
jgi:hypothetical protein